MAKVKADIKIEVKPVANAAALLRKGTRAYIDLYGAAFQRAQMRFEQVKGATDGLFTDLVERGTEIENRAEVGKAGKEGRETGSQNVNGQDNKSGVAFAKLFSFR